MNKLTVFFLRPYWWISGVVFWYSSAIRVRLLGIKRRTLSWQVIDTPDRQFARALDVFLSVMRNELRRLTRERIRELNKFAASPDFEKWATPIAVRGLIFRENFIQFSEAFIDKVKAVILPNCERISDTNLLRLQAEFEWFASHFIEEAIHNQETFFYRNFPSGFPEQMKSFETSQLKSIHSEHSAILESMVKEANLVKRTVRREQRVVYLRQIIISLVTGYLLGLATHFLLP